MKATVAEITQSGKSMIENFSKETIVYLETFENIYGVVVLEYGTDFSLEDLKHITWYVMGYCGLA